MQPYNVQAIALVVMVWVRILIAILKDRTLATTTDTEYFTW